MMDPFYGAIMKKPVLAATAATAVAAPLALLAWKYYPRPGPVGNFSVPEPAKAVDLRRYMGLWFEQFRYDASFEKGLEAVTAEYSLNRNGTVRVVNQGRKGGPNGKISKSVGKAKVEDSATNAKLKVSFFGPFYGNYWVLDHCDNYEWSIVGEPSGRYLWVLTRDAKPGIDMLQDLEARVRALGYDWSLIHFTQQ